MDRFIAEMKKRGEYFSEKELLALFRSICLGVREFHSHSPPLALRDLKPENILLDQKGGSLTPILIDFGRASEAQVAISDWKAARQLQESADATCSLLYKPPELYEVENNMSLDQRTDIWSLGCCLYFMAYHTSPFEDAATQGSVKLAVINGKLNFLHQRYSSNVTALITSMVNVRMNERPFIDLVIQQLQQLV
eukprot:TRINITY_DN1718_c0_g1_i1.p1 TRINITY_DN1718_c0_g1~~TRINITY_DN1718_c0_g1_i1.p1  ORF type:complete len:194 (-),score=35.61 TRINITY_DN1718_c0_g1_i1:122-703(-)